MAFLWPNGPISTLVLRVGGLLTVADDLDVLICPITGTIVAVHCTVTTTGASSANNDFVVERTRSGTSTDMWTPASGVGRIAYDASVKYLDFDYDDLDETDIRASDLLNLNGNVIAGTAATDLTVTLYIVPDGK